MNSRPRFAYLQARCQARFAELQRGNWSAWRGDSPTAGQALPDSRLALSPALNRLAASSNLHEVEQHIRTVFRQLVVELARWAPAEWRPAVWWSALLIDLPALQHLLEGGKPYPWFSENERLAAWTQSLTGAAAGEGATLIKSHNAGSALFDTWRRCWQQRWPAVDRRTRYQLGLVQSAMLHSRQRLGATQAFDRIAEAIWLERHLIGVFRNHLQTPAAMFAYLGLVWLELVRFRGGVVKLKLVHSKT